MLGTLRNGIAPSGWSGFVQATCHGTSSWRIEQRFYQESSTRFKLLCQLFNKAWLLTAYTFLLLFNCFKNDWVILIQVCQGLPSTKLWHIWMAIRKSLCRKQTGIYPRLSRQYILITKKIMRGTQILNPWPCHNILPLWEWG